MLTKKMTNDGEHAEVAASNEGGPLSLSYEIAVRDEEKNLRDSISMYLYTTPRERHINININVNDTTAHARTREDKEAMPAKTAPRQRPARAR